MEFSKKSISKKGYFMPKWGPVQLLCKKFKTGFHFVRLKQLREIPILRKQMDWVGGSKKSKNLLK